VASEPPSISDLVETGGGWRPCPGGPAVNVDPERWEAQCPHCDYTFSTLMDEPVVPPHYVSLNGEVVMFRTEHDA
jgi:hypothetical protein